jgi:hypothetical protein
MSLGTTGSSACCAYGKRYGPNPGTQTSEGTTDGVRWPVAWTSLPRRNNLTSAACSISMAEPPPSGNLIRPKPPNQQQDASIRNNKGYNAARGRGNETQRPLGNHPAAGIGRTILDHDKVEKMQRRKREGEPEQGDPRAAQTRGGPRP